MEPEVWSYTTSITRARSIHNPCGATLYLRVWCTFREYRTIWQFIFRSNEQLRPWKIIHEHKYFCYSPILSINWSITNISLAYNPQSFSVSTAVERVNTVRGGAGGAQRGVIVHHLYTHGRPVLTPPPPSGMISSVAPLISFTSHFIQ